MARILVVEDDPVILRLLEINLELEGHEVLPAEHGDGVLERVAAEAVDLVLLDVMLPGTDGFTICRELRSRPATAELPVVLVSARAQPGDLERGRLVGCSAYVTKPFDPIDLLGLVGRLLAGDAVG